MSKKTCRSSNVVVYFIVYLGGHSSNTFQYIFPVDGTWPSARHWILTNVNYLFYTIPESLSQTVSITANPFSLYVLLAIHCLYSRETTVSCMASMLSKSLCSIIKLVAKRVSPGLKSSSVEWVQKYANEAWWHVMNFATLYPQSVQMLSKVVSQCPQEVSPNNELHMLHKLFLDTLLQWFWPSVLWRCWLGGMKGIQPVKNWVVGCWRGYLSGARCKLAYGPADATATHCFLLQ